MSGVAERESESARSVSTLFSSREAAFERREKEAERTICARAFTQPTIAQSAGRKCTHARGAVQTLPTTPGLAVLASGAASAPLVLDGSVGARFERRRKDELRTRPCI